MPFWRKMCPLVDCAVTYKVAVEMGMRIID